MLTGTVAQAEALPQTIRFGVAAPKTGNPPAFTAGPVGLAYTRGLIEQEFKKDGVKVEWVFFKGAGPATNEALTNKQIDFAFQGDLPSLVGRAGGLQTRLIALGGLRSHVYLAVPPDSPIKSVKDLKGKRVGLSIGTNLQMPVDRILAANGLSERDLRIVNLGLEAIGPALANRGVDAVFGYYPVLAVRDKGLARIVYSNRNAAPEFSCQSGVLVTDEFARRYPQTVTRVLKSLLTAHRWLAEPANQAESYALWERMGIPGQTLREDQAGENPRLQSSPLLDDHALALYQDVANKAYELKLARNKVDVQHWADRSFLDAALKQAKLESYWPAFDAKGKPLAAH
jgi:sulfonate transport system substrate-binding protein